MGRRQRVTKATLLVAPAYAINPDRIADRLAAGERRLSESGVAASIEAAHLDAVSGLHGFTWVREPSTGRMLTELTPALASLLDVQ